MIKSDAGKEQSASELISKRIAQLADWRGDVLARMRKLIHEAAPDVIEEWKWMGTPVWSHAGVICTGESYKAAIKLTFAKGAALPDPKGLFNSSLDGNVRRAIDIHEGEQVDPAAFKALFRAAVAFNRAGKVKPAKKAAAAKKAAPAKKAGKRPTTVDEYIQAALREGQPHLRQMRAILHSVAPHATEVIKWGNPFFVEPRFLFAYSAHKKHLSLAPGEAALESFAKELAAHDATKYMLRIPYDSPIPEALVRKLAKYSLKQTNARKTDSFW